VSSLSLLLNSYEIFFLLFLLILGFVLGSFLNVLADRLPNEKSILGRSKCDNCKKTLKAKDLIPIVSFLYLQGKCRYCHSPLSYQYLFAEILTGVMFVVTYLFVGLESIPNLVFSLVIVSSLIAIFFADLRYGIIPDEILAVAVIASFIWLGIFQQDLFINHLLSGIGAFLFFLMIFLLTRGRGMGFGDVKLAFLLGLFLGFPDIVLALYIAFLTGGIVGIILILWKKKKLKSSVAFGPFLILGTIISFFLSPQIIPEVMALLS
jgi:prepilin signal peptidase PulO-like enzyme (type II secretory pathway)